MMSTDQASTGVSEPGRLFTGRGVAIAGWVIALALGLWQVWFGRFFIAGDGVSYLDMGDAYLRGDWATALNAYWSPFYAWLLGAALRVIRPGPAWEFAVVAGVNVAAYVFALASFQYFWMGLFRWRRTADGAWVGLPEPIWMAFGFLIAMWMALSLITISNVTPDMVVAGFVFLATGLLVRMQAGARSPMNWAVLGAVLGLGYLTKAPMFLLAFVFLGCSWFVAGRARLALPRVALAALIFAAIAGPYVGALSQAKGRFTFGDSGRINYAWDVHGVRRLGWQGGPPGLGTPTHPIRVIHDSPMTFEIDAPHFRQVTLPLWYDPSYWYDGVTPSFQLSGLVRPIGESLGRYVAMYRDQHGLIAGILALYLLSGSLRQWGREVVALWPVWAPALAGVGLFTLAGAETRYVAPFAALMLGGAIAVVRTRAHDARVAVRIGTAVVLVLVAQLLMIHVKPDVLREPRHVNLAIAEGLQQLGLRAGDRIALVRAGHGTVYWARLARLKVAVVVAPGNVESFWLGDAGGQAASINAMAAAGISAIVAPSIPDGASTVGWIPVGDTGYRALLLD